MYSARLSPCKVSEGKSKIAKIEILTISLPNTDAAVLWAFVHEEVVTSNAIAPIYHSNRNRGMLSITAWSQVIPRDHVRFHPHAYCLKHVERQWCPAAETNSFVI